MAGARGSIDRYRAPAKTAGDAFNYGKNYLEP
jgi:hypothetical protein